MANLLAYIIRRLILLVFVILGVTILVFAVTMLLPVNIRALLYINNPQRWRQLIGPTIEAYGLNDPFYLQYGRWLGQVLQGNLGMSISANQPVAEAIAQRWPLTMEIVIFAAPIIIFVGIFIGVQSAIHRDTSIDHMSRVFAVIGWSLPSFLVGMTLLAIFYGWLHVLSPGSLSESSKLYVSLGHYVKYTGMDIFDGLLNGVPWISWDALLHCVLPAVTIVTIDVALLIRVMRSSMLESMSKPYIITARAKGLDEKVVIYKHARRNALIPVATLSGMLVAGLLGGLIITETVFGFGGLGQFAADAARNFDTPAVLGYAILSAVVFVIANLIVDILYAYIDPRIRLE
jgi:ABC-type dipeptide/oligopeptide/nickel transport system permease component